MSQIMTDGMTTGMTTITLENSLRTSRITHHHREAVILMMMDIRPRGFLGKGWPALRLVRLR